jgi:hypothetical protein
MQLRRKYRVKYALYEVAWYMPGCSETGCQEKATHKFNSPSGFRVPLCEKHYLEWQKYEFKSLPLVKLVDIGKWLVRLSGFALLFFGVLLSGFSVLSFIFGWNISLAVDLSLISSGFHYYTQSVLNVFVIAMVIFLSGAALFYIGFWKMEHDLW